MWMHLRSVRPNLPPDSSFGPQPPRVRSGRGCGAAHPFDWPTHTQSPPRPEPLPKTKCDFLHHDVEARLGSGCRQHWDSRGTGLWRGGNAGSLGEQEPDACVDRARRARPLHGRCCANNEPRAGGFALGWGRSGEPVAARHGARARVNARRADRHGSGWRHLCSGAMSTPSSGSMSTSATAPAGAALPRPVHPANSPVSVPHSLRTPRRDPVPRAAAAGMARMPAVHDHAVNDQRAGDPMISSQTPVCGLRDGKSNRVPRARSVMRT
jgi:hypothetical protein